MKLSFNSRQTLYTVHPCRKQNQQLFGYFSCRQICIEYRSPEANSWVCGVAIQQFLGLWNLGFHVMEWHRAYQSQCSILRRAIICSCSIRKEVECGSDPVVRRHFVGKVWPLKNQRPNGTFKTLRPNFLNFQTVPIIPFASAWANWEIEAILVVQGSVWTVIEMLHVFDNIENKHGHLLFEA